MLVDTRVGTLFVEDRGEGDALLLWPSLLTEASMWRFQIPELEKRFRTVVIDPPGHGRSAPVRRRFTLEDCADAAREVMDELGIQKTRWAGLSWGGMTGMRFALRYPDRLESLALLDTSAKRESRRKLPAYIVMNAIAKRIGAIGILIDRIEKLMFCAETLRSKREVVEPFREHLSRMDPESLGHSVDAVIFDRIDIRPELARIAVPTLVMVGAEDKSTPPARAREIADRVRGAKLVVIPGAGHLSALEQPEQVTQALLDHFG